MFVAAISAEDAVLRQKLALKMPSDAEFAIAESFTKRESNNPFNMKPDK